MGSPVANIWRRNHPSGGSWVQSGEHTHGMLPVPRTERRSRGWSGVNRGTWRWPRQEHGAQGHQRPRRGLRMILCVCVMRKPRSIPSNLQCCPSLGEVQLLYGFILCTDAFLTHGTTLFPTKPFYSEEQKSVFLPGSKVIPFPLFDPNDLLGFSLASLPAPNSGS